MLCFTQSTFLVRFRYIHIGTESAEEATNDLLLRERNYEDTKGVIRRRKSHDRQWTNGKRTNKDLLNITQKTKETRISVQK